jgi:pilus assembly protein FimV
LSNESLQNKADRDNADQIAKQRAKDEAVQRKAEIEKNIDELKTLNDIATSGPIEAASAAKVAPTVPLAPPIKPKEPAPTSLDLVDTVRQNLGILAGLVAIFALGAFGIFRRIQGPKSQPGSARREGVAQWETNVNTNFEAGAGQRVDTSDVHTEGLATMVFPESQMEMVNELDPVAEAEVYLAYGKDVPAEEILKEGLQQDPKRVAIHLKLLSVYAKRQDTRSFEAAAKEVSPLVDPSCIEWAQVQEMGKSIDASNPLYSQQKAGASRESSLSDHSTLNFDASASMDSLLVTPTTSTAAARSGALSGADRGESLKTSKNAAANAGSGTDFDLTSISLNPTPVGLPAAPKQTVERLYATLALAEQFIAIDEKEGARALLEEVIAGGDDTLRQRAKALLSRVQ